MKRRGNREGSEPWLRPDGRYQAKWTDQRGRRHVITMPRGSTKTECRDAVRDAIRRDTDGYAPVDRRTTVGRWLDLWLESHVASGPRRRRPRTIESYETVVRVHLKPRLGRIVLSRLTREDVARVLAGVAADGGSPGTVRHVYNILRIALNEAVRSDLVSHNVATRLTPPPVAHREIAPWDADEINRFLDAIAGDRWAPIFTLAIATGLRQGEQLGLRWSDVDLEGRTLTVRRQYTRQGTFTEPKSMAGIRTIGITDLAVWALRAQRRQQAEDRLRYGWANDEDLVFTAERGGPLHHRVVWDAFRTRSVRAGVRPIRYHDLRHACATLMMTGGEELAVISKVLGHADYSTTLRVYAHLDPDRARVAAARIDTALRREIPAEDVPVAR